MNVRPITILTLSLCSCACAQQPPAVPTKPARQQPAEQDPRKLLEQSLEMFAKAGLELDTEARTVTVPAAVGRPDQPIEFALIHRRGKAHEAMFVTDVKSSLLNAALLALGFEKGQNAQIVDKDPMPSEAEIRGGVDPFVIIPPKGMEMWFTVRWTAPDEEGRDVEHHHALEDLLLDLTTERSVEGASWIYLGGQMAPIYRGEPPVFVGDYEGNLISVVYKNPPNQLGTMRHERAADDQIWWLTDLVPPTGTAVRFTIHATRPQLVAEREARLKRERREREGPTRSDKK